MPVVWVRLDRYCELTGEPRTTVLNRIKQGGWVQGIHWTTRERRRWVNLERAQEWVEDGELVPA